MVSTSILSSSVLSFHPFPGSSKHGLHDPKRASRTRIFASRKEAHDQNHSSRMVDENMIVLRKRIHEMKMVERNYEPPSDWMDWEKRIYTSYDSFICGVMGFLQSQMMNSRPSLTLGMLVLNHSQCANFGSCGFLSSDGDYSQGDLGWDSPHLVIN